MNENLIQQSTATGKQEKCGERSFRNEADRDKERELKGRRLNERRRKKEKKKV